MLRLVMYYFQVNEYFMEIFEKCSLSFIFPATSSSFVSSNIYLSFYYLCAEYQNAYFPENSLIAYIRN